MIHYNGGFSCETSLEGTNFSAKYEVCRPGTLSGEWSKGPLNNGTASGRFDRAGGRGGGSGADWRSWRRGRRRARPDGRRDGPSGSHFHQMKAPASRLDGLDFPFPVLMSVFAPFSRQRRPEGRGGGPADIKSARARCGIGSGARAGPPGTRAGREPRPHVARLLPFHLRCFVVLCSRRRRVTTQ